MPSLKPGLFCAVAFVVACGGDDSDAFLPFDNLCSAYAEQICAASARCCDAPVEPSCESELVSTCDAERLRLAEQSGLRYDGEHAEEVLDAQGQALARCEPAFVVARFFSGGAKDGSPCTTASQCESQVCSDKVCSDASVAWMCPAP